MGSSLEWMGFQSLDVRVGHVLLGQPQLVLHPQPALARGQVTLQWVSSRG